MPQPRQAEGHGGLRERPDQGVLHQVLGLAVIPAQQERLAFQGPGLVAGQLGKGLLPALHAAPRS